MKFDIKNHVLDHMQSGINRDLLESKDVKHFNTSADIAYFIQNGYNTTEKINEVMNKIIEFVHDSVLTQREKNGVYINQKNIVRQKYRNRKIKFDKIVMIYHNRHFDDSKHVHPHLHILHHKKARLGKDYIYLKKILRQAADKFGIKFNFMADTTQTGLTQTQQMTLKRMSWVFHQNNRKQIRKYIENGSLRKCLAFQETHYQNSENISYYVKTFNIVNQRLFEMDIDFDYKGQNLKDVISFSLLEKHDHMLYMLHVGELVTLNLHKVLDRELFKYFQGFGSDSIQLLSNEYNLDLYNMDNIRIGHNSEMSVKKRSGNATRQLDFRDHLLKDIGKALSYARNINEFKKNMKKLGYKNICMKYSRSSSKSYVTGLNLLTPQKQKKVFVNLEELGLGWKTIKFVFDRNKKIKKKSSDMDTESSLEKYVPNNSSEIAKKDTVVLEHKVPRKLSMFYRGNVNLKYAHLLSEDYELVRSDLYDISTLKHTDGHIISDYGTHLVLTQDRSRVDGVEAMLDISRLKGWDESLIEYRGDEDYTNLAEIKGNSTLKNNQDSDFPNKSDHGFRL